jgi:hypothetical protein
LNGRTVVTLRGFGEITPGRESQQDRGHSTSTIGNWRDPRIAEAWPVTFRVGPRLDHHRECDEKACYETVRRSNQYPERGPDAAHTRSVKGVSEKEPGDQVAAAPLQLAL